ncbi:MAG: cupin domain-containing protein [Roseiflexaceae bacterium]
MDAFELADLLTERERSDKLYLEFLRVPALSMGLYVLRAGGVDPQQPHSEDEVYYIVSGRGAFCCGEEDRPVAAGSLLYVPATVAHRFHTIEEQLVILVFFAPAEESQAG